MSNPVKCLELLPCHSVLVSMDTILPQTVILPATRIGLRLASDKLNKVKADPEHKRAHESVVIRYRAGLKRDCTQMVDLL
jgi:hypothetical protein